MNADKKRFVFQMIILLLGFLTLYELFFLPLKFYLLSISHDSVCLRRQSARFKSGEESTENNVDTKRFVLTWSRIMYSFGSQMSIRVILAFL